MSYRWRQMWLAALLVFGTLAGIRPVWAHPSAKAKGNAMHRAVVRDRTAWVLARALGRSLPKAARIVGMKLAKVNGRSGYLVAFTRGRAGGTLFVSDTGTVRHLSPKEFRMQLTRADTSLPSTSLANFLAALQTTLSQLSGTPVSATALPGGGMNFTVNVAGTVITVTVSAQSGSANPPGQGSPSFGTSAGSSSSGQTSSGTSGGANNFRPAVGSYDLTGVVNAALGAVSSLSSFSGGAYVVKLSLEGYIACSERGGGCFLQLV